ncbi:MAG: YggS family pyridoxal phosphate-dependent enzyme [Bdellovibrionota bacterium]
MSVLGEIQTIIKNNYVPHGSSVKEAQLIAVSKLQSVEKVRALYNQGQKVFGENYVQEALLKKSSLDSDIQWHFIGSLQKNKVKQIIGQFTLIHSVDSMELAALLSQKAKENQITQKILLQVNAAGEVTKHGFEPDVLLQQFSQIKQLPNLEIRGLMTMPPLGMDGEVARPHFRRLRELRDQLGVVELSMGTSHDFKVALAEGATLIRLGTILFGERSPK